MRVITLLILGLSSLHIGAQDVKFTVEVSNDTLLLGNYFELKYTVENASGNSFEPPQLTQMDIIGGPNTSTSMSIINGEMSQSSSYAYYIEPSDIGAYTIPPAYLTVGEEVMETLPIEIMVLPNPEGIIQPPGQAGTRLDQYQVVPDEKESKPKRPRKKF